MSATKTANTETKPVRKVRSIEEEIAAQRAKLKSLEDRQREQQRKERERNQKAVMEIIKAEKLDTATAEQWANALPTIKKALFESPAKSHKAIPLPQSQPSEMNGGTGEVAFSTNPQTP